MFSFFSTASTDAEPRVLESRTLEAIASYIKSGDVKRITVLTGAGISTAAGIPDFRSPGTGLYANLERLNLPYAEAVFDIAYFRLHPEPFYYLAKELYPGKFHPTVSHAFIALLEKKGLLHMDFTQNIDCLERMAGVPDRKIVEAHGSFASQRCIDCHTPFDDDKMDNHVRDEIVPRCENCGGLVKPDIVFFGEALPNSFRENAHKVVMSDLAIIIGTSLSVYPFAGLAEMVPSGIPRLLFNKERVGRIGDRSDDVSELGSCDDGVRRLADLLGWRDELEALWRSVVGDKEAERQLSNAATDSSVDEEIRKLTEGMESGLKLTEPGDTVSKIEVEEPEVTVDIERTEQDAAEQPSPSKKSSETAEAKLELSMKAEDGHEYEAREPARKEDLESGKGRLNGIVPEAACASKKADEETGVLGSEQTAAAKSEGAKEPASDIDGPADVGTT